MSSKLMTIVVVFALISFGSCEAMGNLVTDGDFETPCGGSEFWTFHAPTTFGPWTIPVVEGVLESSVDVVKTTWPAATGGQSVDLDGVARGAIYQDLATAFGEQYTLEFAMAGNPDTSWEYPGKTRTMEVWWGNTLVDTLVFDTTGHEAQGSNFKYADIGWQYHQYTVVSQGGQSRLLFKSLTEGPFGAALDDVSVTLVPEPASLAVLAAGVVCGRSAHRRRARPAVHIRPVRPHAE